jgi:lysozyme family protein
MDYFSQAFTLVVGIEAGYVNDPHDPGGETKFGISKRAYPALDIPNVTLIQSQGIYQRDYWNACACGSLPWPLALLVFDCAVNQGQGTARTMLQTALGVAADGNLGPSTLAAAKVSTTYHAARFMTLRAKRYQQDPNYARYGDGWFARLFTIALKQGG